MIWDTTDPHGWLYSRVWFTCISQFRKDICNKQDVPSWTHVILFFSVYIAVFTSCLFFFCHVCPRRTIATGHRKGHVLYIDHIQGIVSPVDPPCLPPVSASSQTWQKFIRLPYPFFPCGKKKNDSPDWDVTRLTCPSFCLLNLCAELIWCVWGEHNDE